MTRVRKVANPSMTGELTGDELNAGGIRLVEVRWDSSRTSKVPFSQLEAIPQEVLRLEDHIQRPRFGQLDDLRRLLTFQKLQGSLHDFIYSMDAARIEFLEYQYKPVLKFIDSPTERLLIADEVGLGKTIEASLIWLELQARRNARRLLVVCPGMLISKWRRELQEKFGVAAEIRDPASALDGVRQIVSAGRNAPAAWIVSYTSFRPWKDDWLTLNDPELKNPLSPRGRFLDELRHASEETPFFDLAIFDEAHLMRNPETANSRLGRFISECSRSILCVSATPVNNSSEDLFSLLRLLDQDFFSSSKLFDQLLDENRAAITAMNCLIRQPVDVPKLRESLKALKKSRLVGNHPALDRAISEASQLTERDYDRLIRMQSLVEDLNILGSYVSRTRRRQVKERRAIRRVHILPVEFSDQESRFYWGVTTGVRLRVAREGGQFSIFHLIMPQLRMASCIPAMIESYRSGNLEDLDALVEAGTDEDGAEDANENTFFEVVDKLQNDLRHFDFESNDTKYRALKDYILTQLQGKAVLFSFFKATLKYLARRLTSDGIRCSIIHGDVSQLDREDILSDFEHDETIHVLLSSEVGSEGIDLQFCNVLVNYDLPWNPMRIEQRIGRIDRVGQKSETLTIVHLKVANTIEDRVYRKLHAKLQIFENSIGDLEAVLGQEEEKLRRGLLSKELTPEEEESMIDQTEHAVRTRMEQIRQLEEAGGSLLAHGDFISARVGSHRDMRRFITPQDLEIYLKDFFARSFPGCREVWHSPREGCFSINLTMDAARSLADFVTQEKYPSHPGISDQRVWGTFHTEIAKLRDRNREIPLHNHLSPLVRWITSRNEQVTGGVHPLAAFKWRTKMLAPGIYSYRIERWTLTGLRKQEHLCFGISNMTTSEMWSPLDSEKLLGAALQEAERWDLAETEQELWLSTQRKLKQQFELLFDQACRDFEARNSGLLQIQVAQVNRHFDRRRSIDQQRLTTMKEKGRRDTMLRLVESNMKKDQERRVHRIGDLQHRAIFSPEISDIGAGLIKVEAA